MTNSSSRKEDTIFQMRPRTHEIYGPGKSGRNVAQTEPNPSKLVQAVPGDEDCFLLVLWADLISIESFKSAMNRSSDML